MSEFNGVQDVFCGTQTIVHMKAGSAALDPDAVEEVFTTFEVEFEGIERDDTALF